MGKKHRNQRVSPVFVLFLEYHLQLFLFRIDGRRATTSPFLTTGKSRQAALNRFSIKEKRVVTGGFTGANCFLSFFPRPPKVLTAGRQLAHFVFFQFFFFFRGKNVDRGGGGGGNEGNSNCKEYGLRPLIGKECGHYRKQEDWTFFTFILIPTEPSVGVEWKSIACPPPLFLPYLGPDGPKGEIGPVSHALETRQ